MSIEFSVNSRIFAPLSVVYRRRFLGSDDFTPPRTNKGFYYPGISNFSILTGGVGALGLATSTALVERGGQQFCLISRGGRVGVSMKALLM